MTPSRISYGIRLGAAFAATSLLLAAGGAARADVVIDCKTMNAANIARGLADVNGYSIDPAFTSSGTGSSIFRYLALNVSRTVALPPDGILCVRYITCSAASGATLSFTRNDANTPVYLLVQDTVQLNNNNCRIDASGGPAVAAPGGMGLTVRGGIGGPGGSDGGSCDGTGAGRRAGNGVGPGGGRGASAAGGGGGASPVTDGGGNFEGDANGGAHFALPSYRMVHGGSGGGCGYNAAGTSAGGGGGGGGVLVVAAGQYIEMDGTYSGFWARGGGERDASNLLGGWGGGGVVRLISDEIRGTGGHIDVRAETTNTSGATSYCGPYNASYAGGCGGAGLILIEGPLSPIATDTQFVANSLPQSALGTGASRDPLPDSASAPTLAITQVFTNWTGVAETLIPIQTPGAGADHVHASVGVFLDSPSAPAQVVVVTLASNNVPDTAVVNVKMNAVGTPAVTVVATLATGSGSGALTWEASLTVPGGTDLGTLEAWISNVCTAGSPGCTP